MPDTPAIILPGNSPSGWTEYAYSDLIQSKGTILIAKPSAEGGWDYGTALPVVGNKLTNLAWRGAAKIIGSGDRDSLALPYRQNGLVGTSSSKHKSEWTTKKGFHSILSQTVPLSTSTGDSLGFNLPPLVKDYIFTNTPSHKFYFGWWRAVTRIQVMPVSAPQPFTAFCANSGTTANFLFYHDCVSLKGTGTKSTVTNTIGAQFSAMEVSVWTGTKPSLSSDMTNNVWAWLNGTQGAFASFNSLSCPSEILYKMTIEDLNVSGRTFAEVRDLDNAMFTAAFASGGEFFGDSNTDPATLP